MTPIVRRITQLASLLPVLLLLLACSAEQSPQERLEATLQEMRDAVVAGHIGQFMDGVSDDFSGQRGTLDRGDLKGMLRLQLLKHSRVTATIVSDEYQMFSQRARVTLGVLMTGGPGNWLPDRGRLFSIETGWREDHGQWLLISAVWD